MIDRDEIEVQLWWADDESDRAGVRLIHKATGVVAESIEHATQIANYDAALVELERKVEAVFE